MNRDYAIGFFLLALILGGVFLLARRPQTVSDYTIAPVQQYSGGTARMVATEVKAEEEGRRYRNKEIRRIKYNDDNLPVEIEIIRDFAIT